MKKYFIIGCVSLIASISSAYLVLAGYNFGPNNIFHMDASSGFDFRGIWVEGTMSNGTAEATNYEKQVCAWSGEEGSCSAWATRDKASVTHRDYGPLINNNYSKVEGYWK